MAERLRRAIAFLPGSAVNVGTSEESNAPIERIENSTERPPSRGGDRPDGEFQSALSEDRQLQQPPSSQENPTPMDPEDDTRRRRGTEQPQRSQNRSTREAGESWSNHGTGAKSRRNDDGPSGGDACGRNALRCDGGKSSDERSDGGDPSDGRSDRGDNSDERSDREDNSDEEIPSWKGGSDSAANDEGDAFGETGGDDGGDDGGDERDGESVEPAGAPDITELQREVARLRSELDEFERDVESRTVERPKLESELKRYVRGRMRRGHARGWGPYLVLLYGTVLTLGAFYWLDGAYAIGAMLILALSTLGLYVLFVLFGIGLNVADVPFRAVDAYRRRRE